LLRRDYGANVISFGKLPKKAIQIPKYTGGSTTPDFVYIVEKPDNTKVYLLVETKAEGSGKRISDTQIMAIQKEFFGQLKENGVAYKVATTAEDVFTKLRGISK
ncbi:VRR-NUC domain-containing protein, partial [Latilactobacillus sakei]